MRILTVIIILLICSCGAKKELTSTYKNMGTSFWEGETCFFRTTPVTNREYLLFLCWNIEVYGERYPDEVLALFPYETQSNSFIDCFTEVSDATINNYFLNPIYLDFPVMSLQKNQVTSLMHWMSDRYNENVLIRNNYLEYSTRNQRNEDCFNLESYLAEQYNGSSKNDTRMRWTEGQFLPTFRLPNAEETELIIEHTLFPKNRKPYPVDHTHFLKIWNDDYITVSEKGKKVVLKLKQLVTLIANSSIDMKGLGTTTIANVEIEKVFKNIRFPSELKGGTKNEFGRQNFVIINQNKSKKTTTAQLSDSLEGIYDKEWIIPCFSKNK